MLVNVIKLKKKNLKEYLLLGKINLKIIKTIHIYIV